jgi:hypothetical protein
MPVRYKSTATFLEMPVVSIAVGPDRQYVVAPLHRDPEAVEFFSRLVHGILGKFGAMS